MAITSLNELWGKKWVLAENPTVMGGDYGQSYLKLNPAPSAPLHIATYNYNYFSSDELYVAASTGTFLTFWGKHSTINAYGIPWESSTVTSFIIRTSTVWVEPKGATPRLMEFIPQPSGYSFEENDLIVEFWNNNFVEVDEVVIDVKEEYEKLFESIGNSIRNKTGGSSKIYPTSIPAEIGKIGNSGATGTITITTNGTHDVAAYATANVNVPNTIPEGYIKPEGSLDITENGDYDVTTKVSVTVNVEGSGGGDTSIEDGLIEGTLTSYTNDRVTKIDDFAFYYSPIKSISMPNVTTIGNYAFSYSETTTINLPKLLTANQYAFRYAKFTNFENNTLTQIGDYCFAYSNLTTIKLSSLTTAGEHAFDSSKFTKIEADYLPKVETVKAYGFQSSKSLTSISLPSVTNLGNYCFTQCSALTDINVPKLTTVGRQTFSPCAALERISLPSLTTISDMSLFLNSNKLEFADLGNATNLPSQTFFNCYSLKTVIIRTNSVCSMAATNVFGGCYHFLGTVSSTYNPNGLKDGCIYVPDDLVDSYKAASNWSTFADCIKPLSEYVEE